MKTDRALCVWIDPPTRALLKALTAKEELPHRATSATVRKAIRLLAESEQVEVETVTPA